ncbi:MAG: hypothetical protein AB1941_10115 [Gemmatimonadota bacterium]
MELLAVSVTDGDAAAQAILRAYGPWAPERGRVWGETDSATRSRLLANALAFYLLGLSSPCAFDLDAFESHLVAWVEFAMAFPPAMEGTDADLAELIRIPSGHEERNRPNA